MSESAKGSLGRKPLSKEVLEQAEKDLQALKELQPIVHFEVTVEMAMSVIAFIQFALKHHALKNHPSHVLAEGFARQIEYRIGKTDELRQVIDAGWEEDEGTVH